MPRLSVFITEHAEEILAAWEAFAKDLSGATTIDLPALRDHADAMLNVIVADLETPQTDKERDRKAHGLLDAARDGTLTAASEHGRGRAEHGFSVESMVAEFRALRESVITLWLRDQQGGAGPSELEEVRRFNEAIDQAIAEALAQYTHVVESARDRFLAVLGHDLRAPLSAVVTSTRFLLDEGNLKGEQRDMLAGVERSGRRMTQLIEDLLQLAVTRLGGLPLRRTRTDLGLLVREVGAEVSAISPTAQIDIETSGTLVGEWDRPRLSQAFTNLLTNALEYGSPGKPISVIAHGDGDKGVTVEVTNQGAAIPRDQLASLFTPMKPAAADRRDRRHLGLGLYIVDRVIDAHGGSIKVRSSDEHGTTFTVTLPRDGAQIPAKH